jgi:hypothetical protein
MVRKFKDNREIRCKYLGYEWGISGVYIPSYIQLIFNLYPSYTRLISKYSYCALMKKGTPYYINTVYLFQKNMFLVYKLSQPVLYFIEGWHGDIKF